MTAEAFRKELNHLLYKQEGRYLSLEKTDTYRRAGYTPEDAVFAILYHDNQEHWG